MGDLVEGIGDEVLLFGAFLAFTACIVIVVNFWQGRSGRDRQPQPSQGTGNQQNASAAAEPQELDTSNSQQSTSAQRGPSPSSVPSDGTELRSRLRTSAASSGDSGLSGSSGTSRRDNSSQTGHTGSGVAESERPSQQKEAEGGGGGAGEDDSLITIRLIMYGSTTKSVQVSPTTTLADMRRVHFSQEISENRPVKFIYQGRVLNNESATLLSLNITDGCPIHVHVGRPRETPQQRAENEQQHANEFLDLSRFFVPLFGVILGIAWVGLFCYPSVFTLITKLFLFFLSVGYILLAYSTSFA